MSLTEQKSAYTGITWEHWHNTSETHPGTLYVWRHAWGGQRTPYGHDAHIVHRHDDPGVFEVWIGPGSSAKVNRPQPDGVGSTFEEAESIAIALVRMGYQRETRVQPDIQPTYHDAVGG